MSRGASDRGAAGPSQRQLRVGETLRRALAEALARGETHDPELSRHVITVTEVRPSPDLRNATVYVAPLGGRDEAGALAALAKNRATLRRIIGRTVRLKYTPDLSFTADRSFDRMDETRRLLSDERVRRDLHGDGDRGEDGDD